MYHDNEWGVPVHSEQKHFEFLMMEVMQFGLNWLMMLKRREVFRQCFDNFDFQLVASYAEIYGFHYCICPPSSKWNINAHERDCYRYHKLVAEYPVKIID